MTTKLVKWASNDGQIIKSGLSDGYGGKAITTAAHLDYDRHGFEGYPGNVGLDRVSQRLTDRVGVLAVRYEGPLPAISAEVNRVGAKVDEHLKTMGFTWT